VAPEQRADADLQDGSLGHLGAEPTQTSLKQAAGTLGVDDEDPEVLLADVAARVDEYLAETSEGHLEEDPACPG